MGCMNCGGKMKMKSGGKKKSNFDPSSLPSSKGISTKPAIMRDASPNFVEEGRKYKVQEKPVYKLTDLGPNLGTNERNKNVPRIEYRKFERNGNQRANMQQMNKEGNFEYLQSIGCGKPGCESPVPSSVMKSGGKWIQSAIKKPGSFTAQAKKAGMSVPRFRDKVLSNKEKFSSTTVKRANLAKTLSKMRKGEDGMLNTSGVKTVKNIPIKTTKGQTKEMPKMSTVTSRDKYGIRNASYRKK